MITDCDEILKICDKTIITCIGKVQFQIAQSNYSFAAIKCLHTLSYQLIKD